MTLTCSVQGILSVTSSELAAGQRLEHLSTVGTLWLTSDAPGSYFPDLERVETLLVRIQGKALLSGLLSVWTLEIDDCEQTPALVDVRILTLTGSRCALPTLGPSGYRGSMSFSGDGAFILPDGLDNKVYMQGGDNSLQLEYPTRRVYLGGDAVTPAHRILESGYRIEVDLPLATSLGTLTELRSAGELLYCLPNVPTAEVSAWLAGVSVARAVENTCPWG